MIVRSSKEDPNNILIMCIPNRSGNLPTLARSKMQQAKASLSQRFASNNGSDGSGNNNIKSRLISCIAVAAMMLLFVNTLSPNIGDSSSSNGSLSSSLRYSSSNRFSYSKINSPYEQIWINSKLPGWAMKKREFRNIEDTVAPEDRICFVHVGSAY